MISEAAPAGEQEARPRRAQAPNARAQLLRLPFQRATTAQVCSIYPFQVDAGAGVRGLCMGLDALSGSGFYVDPFTLYSDRVITNPNMLVLGEVGAGKSSFVKTFMARNVCLLAQRVRRGDAERVVGRQVFCIDPKQEYRALAEALDIPILRLRPGGSTRINPLARGAVGAETRAELLARRIQLMAALLASIKGRRLNETENAVLGWALETLTDNETGASCSLGDLAAELAEPSESTLSRARREPNQLREEARSVWLDVDRLLTRDLAGMFDGDGSLSERWERAGPGLILDVSAVLKDKRVLSLVMLAAISALQSVYAVADGADDHSVPRRLSVVDEGWAVLGDEDAARFFQESIKLSRRWGVSNILVMHNVANAGAQADRQSATSQIAEGLIADCEIKVIFRTHPKVLEQTAAAFALTSEEAAALTTLPQGRALWRFGGVSAFVDHVRADFETSFTNTDSRMEV